MVAQQQQKWPGDIDPGEFRRVSRELADAIADYHADLSGRGLPTDFTPEEARALFAVASSGEGESAAALVADWCGRVVPRLTAVAGLRELFAKNLVLAVRLHDLVGEHPDFEVLHEPTFYLYCFRYVPNGLAERQEEPGVQALLDRLNRDIAGAVRRGGPSPLTTARARGRAALRLSFCSHRTTEKDIDVTFEAIARWGQRLTRSRSARYEKPTEMEALRCSSEPCSSPTEV
ncbi:MAG: hypothetical protein LC746_16215 [Acidobacteria bacterium]|nr:hypothetical protein [Acidobacteriota bacterium]